MHASKINGHHSSGWMANPEGKFPKCVKWVLAVLRKIIYFLNMSGQPVGLTNQPGFYIAEGMEWQLHSFLTSNAVLYSPSLILKRQVKLWHQILKPQTAQLQYKAGGLGCVCVCFREVFLQMNKIHVGSHTILQTGAHSWCWIGSQTIGPRRICVLEFWLFFCGWGFGVGVFGFWAWDNFFRTNSHGFIELSIIIN